MRVTILGTGYVGLTTAVALAHLGNEVRCLDLDAHKVERLSRGECPIFEPGLEALMRASSSRLKFTTRADEAIPGAEVVFITVGTPPLSDGSPDLSQVQSAAHAIGEHLATDGAAFVTIVNKSTVPIGSGNLVDTLVREGISARGRQQGQPAAHALASNPEFLREGAALNDTFYPDRVVIGADHPMAVEMLAALYRPILDQTFTPPPGLPRPDGFGPVPRVLTDLASAELIKYAANAFLALKISFINEIGEIAERVGGDILQVAEGIGLDRRIGPRFLQPGLGWGGSCFGKDTAALVATAAEYGLSMPTVQAAREVNYRQRARVVSKLLAELKTLKGRTIGLLGLAFKPQTDDLRDAPGLDIARRLIERGARVKAHDPVALGRARQEHGALGIEYCDDVARVAAGSEALVLVTEWPEYQQLPWPALAASMRGAVLLDGRNFLSKPQLEAAGFRTLQMGR